MFEDNPSLCRGFSHDRAIELLRLYPSSPFGVGRLYQLVLRTRSVPVLHADLATMHNVETDI